VLAGDQQPGFELRRALKKQSMGMLSCPAVLQRVSPRVVVLWQVYILHSPILLCIVAQIIGPAIRQRLCSGTGRIS
jgi:hypothetical protein